MREDSSLSLCDGLQRFSTRIPSGHPPGLSGAIRVRPSQRLPSAGLGDAVQSAAGGLCEVKEGGGRRETFLRNVMKRPRLIFSE